MGICASISSSVIHDDTYGHDNAVYYRGTVSLNANESQRIGSTYSHTGSKGLNQDSAILFQGYGIEDGAFGAVFDGHGKNGHIVSKIVRNRLPSLLLSQRNGIAKISPSAVSTKQSDRLESDQSGPSKNFLKWKEACGEDLVIANLGDSRAVLGTRTENGIRAVQLTTDFKPGVPSEAERIRKCKGRVLALKEEPHIQRVWLPYDDSPGLAMSRAFGDFVLKNHGIIAIPDVSYHHVSPDDQFLVLASDGVWDVLSNDEVVSLVSEVRSEEAAAKAVVDAAVASWKHKFPNSKRDDCTVICLFLQI
ncbi:UNVERIFIED_CONTAM: putative protein phosphatase 2C 72 [Sesamum radiatum]|uniref:PPM-type phosphatase domain-containing protein n=1 Tax=Sesamum radiatum TaxID=300843 RepID=A0AAW2KXS9_SESRA